MVRWFRFLLVILIGIGLGLIYGWLVNPIEYVDTSPNTLRVDYKSDYVLMVAESYQLEQDTTLVLRRLALLGSDPAADIVRQALLFAEKQGYTDADIALMRTLLMDIDNQTPLLETPSS
jgi:hypothetical protein